MNKVILYTTHCPKCRILEKKLQDKKVEYDTVEDVEEMKKIGISTVPVLSVPDKGNLQYLDAVKFVNAL
jgi:glutaredoxin-related protein